MEVRDLPGVIVTLVLIGMLIGVGIITFIELGDAARATTTATDENHTFLTAGTTLTQSEVASFTSLKNHSTTLTLNTHYNVSIGDTSTVVYVDAAYNSQQLNATYNYYTDTTTTTAMDNVTTAVSALSNTWMALIVTILALAIILGLVIRSFGGGR